MIAPMKHLTLLCVSSARACTLSSLRELGCVHLDLSNVSSAPVQGARAGLEDAMRAVRLVSDAVVGKVPTVSSSETSLTESDLAEPVQNIAAVPATELVKSILNADARRQRILNAIRKLRRTIRTYTPFGDFDPDLVATLSKSGYQLSLASAPLAFDLSQISGTVFRLGEDGGSVFFAVVNGGKLPHECEPVALLSERLSVIEARLRLAETRSAEITTAIATAAERISSMEEMIPGLKDRVAFAAAEDVLKTRGEVAWIQGWIPADAVPALRACSAKEGWGLMLRDPADDEIPPTLIRPPKMFRSISALFLSLGIAPAYTECDVSVPFFCYFSIFFAMLVGDGGYGLIILAAALWLWRKVGKKVPRSWVVLLTVFSSATVIWGVLTNTWFGASIPMLNNPVSHWLDTAVPTVGFGGGDDSYHHIMLLCFTIGVSHLMLARLWNAVCVFPDRTFVAQLGWAGILLFMYWVVCTIVGIFPGPFPRFLFWIFGVSLFAVFFFTIRLREVKTRGVELGMLPLNIMSALGDIISYVRLFAVGLASVKVAQNFNGMALDLALPVWLKIIPLILILLVGHALNFAMAGLAILVHALRLNTLEFSSHKGVSWSGYAFSPFRKH